MGTRMVGVWRAQIENSDSGTSFARISQAHITQKLSLSYKTMGKHSDKYVG